MRTEIVLPRQKEKRPFSEIKFAGFDLDGTLLQEPQRGFPEVFAEKTTRLFGLDPEKTSNFATSTMGIPTFRQLHTISDAIELPANHILRFISPDLRQFIADAVDSEFFNQPVQLFPDVLVALNQLKQQGIQLFVSSSRPTENIISLLKNHPELTEVIDFAIGTDPKDPNCKKGEGHFRKAAEHFGISFEKLIQQSVFIGDTPSDVKAGNSIGVATIGRTSTKTSEELEGAGATITLGDFFLLPSLFASERTIPSENIYERR